jgi:hypothetical protein
MSAVGMTSARCASGRTTARTTTMPIPCAVARTTKSVLLRLVETSLTSGHRASECFRTFGRRSIQSVLAERTSADMGGQSPERCRRLRRRNQPSVAIAPATGACGVVRMPAAAAVVRSLQPEHTCRPVAVRTGRRAMPNGRPQSSHRDVVIGTTLRIRAAQDRQFWRGRS